MWNKVYLHLKSKGIKVYSPGQHKGLCEDSYVVLRDGGGDSFAGTNKVGQSILDVIIYHPNNRYSSLDSYKKEVKKYLEEVKGIRKTGFETPVLMEDEKQAYTTSIEYQILKRL